MSACPSTVGAVEQVVDAHVDRWRAITPERSGEGRQRIGAKRRLALEQERSITHRAEAKEAAVDVLPAHVAAIVERHLETDLRERTWGTPTDLDFEWHVVEADARAR